MLWGNANDGVMCPVSMTYAAVPALRDGAPDLAAEWEPRLTLPDYEAGALAGMAMTERQGGSDVRANITRAEPVGDGAYELHGHKWFCSYPPCDVFLVLAQAPGGLSCFLVERGAGMEFQRLKDKLGTRSLPSSEVEFRGAPGRLVGEEGRGVPAIIRMVNHTRLDCLLGSTTGLRRGTLEAIHHARHRSAFGARLVDQPAMRNVLADLAIESEAATVTALRVARSYDEPGEGAFRRFATAVCKYWVSKRAAGHAAEALECLGGNGFVEDSGMPLLYRDAPLNSIWEGSGNVAALDVLRAIVKEPEGLPAFLAECELAAGAEPRLDAHLAAVRERVTAVFAGGDGDSAEERLYAGQFSARRVVEDLAVALQASLLVRHAPTAVADAFCAGRLQGDRGRVYGTLPAGVDAAAIIERALPAAG
jgi:putative acyl-CoA dehydrogenase